MNTNDDKPASPPASYLVDWKRVADNAASALLAGETLDELMIRPAHAHAGWLLSAARRLLALTRQWRNSCGWIQPPGWDQIEANLIGPLDLAAAPIVASGDQPQSELDEITRIDFACIQHQWVEGWKQLRPLLAHTPRPTVEVARLPDGPLGGKQWRHAGIDVKLPNGGVAIQAMKAALDGKPGDIILADRIDGYASASGAVTRFNQNIAYLLSETLIDWPHNRVGQSIGDLVVIAPDIASIMPPENGGNLVVPNRID